MLSYHTHQQKLLISLRHVCIQQEKFHLIQASIIPHFIETPSTQLGPQAGQVQRKLKTPQLKIWIKGGKGALRGH